MSNVFITGTGTDIGKTYVTHSLLEYDQTQVPQFSALKPLISGVTQENINQSDSAVLLSAMGLSITKENIQRISPWRYQTPVAPDLAQRLENKVFHFSELIDFCTKQIKAENSNNQHIIIEGVGGLMSPISTDKTVLDWVDALSIPVLLVAGTYLGSISHTLTCITVLQAQNIPILGIVLNETCNSSVSILDTKRSIMQFTNLPIFIYRYQQEKYSAVADLYEYVL